MAVNTNTCEKLPLLADGVYLNGCWSKGKTGDTAAPITHVWHDGLCIQLWVCMIGWCLHLLAEGVCLKLKNVALIVPQALTPLAADKTRKTLTASVLPMFAWCRSWSKCACRRHLLICGKVNTRRVVPRRVSPPEEFPPRWGIPSAPFVFDGFEHTQMVRVGFVASEGVVRQS